MQFINKIISKNAYVFCVLWLTLFVLYLPAANAGFVSDFTGWLQHIKGDSFLDYINLKAFKLRSLYQFTQFSTYVLYKILGTSTWGWHIVHITLQALNSVLLYQLFKKLFDDSGIQKADIIALTGSLLFCITPYISEVVVWESAFHYLQGVLLIALVLVWVQKYQHSQQQRYIWYSGIVFFLSTFSLEIFYLTPWLVLSMALYYRIGLQYDKVIFKKVLINFFLIEIVLFLLHLVLYHAVYGQWIAHIGEKAIANQTFSNMLSRPLKYCFHIFFMGRFFPTELKEKIYTLCASAKVMMVFYTIVGIISIYIIARFPKMKAKPKALSLIFVYMCMALAILSAVWFIDSFLLVGDRYTYIFDAFAYFFIALILSCIPVMLLHLVILTLFTLINLRYTIQLNRYWMKSERIINSLNTHMPYAANKVIVLLNLPQCMHGIPMITATKEGEYKLMHDLLYTPAINNIVFDGAAYNMITPTDGAHVTVVNDTLMKVTLNQWGTWWWYEGLGALSYENEYYKIRMVDPGHWYEMVLKQDPNKYQLLYQVGDQWKVVDWSKKNVDQN